ncbi:endolytic transglycosylase MltG [Streptomyces sp. ME02-8801-2C]|uniref:endolytic transglycosylase MltG n=1 Tax=Streptomyces sp. ME02-8801-2C TaxID=3028680 RepID=UPI0029A9A301|nr:endolytic transglycosylase MltG [Streptomyces sp. ME02-8801-2C]MDX3455199.1 endolytic transglycosylase MltG [Streptomyces sp. ME02-8801-2C]
MTEYGRGQGSEPWHPEDPLYGDGGWEGQQAQAGQSSYDGQPQHYPQQPQQQYGEWSADGQQAAYDQAQQQYAPQQYPQQYQQHPQHQQQYPQQYGEQAQQQYVDQGRQQYANGGWGNGQQAQVPYPADPTDPYAQQAAAAYGGQQQPDYYGTPDAYPPPEPPARRRAEPEPQPEPDPEPQTGWDPGPDQGEHAFFAGGDDGDEPDDEAEGRRDRGSRKGRDGGKGDKSEKGGKGGKSKKGRSGTACLIVVLVFGGGIAGIGYFGYQFYQNRFGAPPDFTGDGTSATVTVEIAKGAGGYEIAQALKEKGVIASVDAFVTAQANNPDGKKIQAGVYVLNKEMSAKSAVALMLNPKSQDNMIVAPGRRNVQVYKAIDEKLGLPAGTTAKVAKKDYKSFGLPDWANDNKEIKDPLEGFLYPTTYPAAKGMKPAEVLKEMVAAATAKYASLDLEAKAKELKLDGPLQVITVASLVEAEGKTSDDYRKMAEVVYNRIDYSNPETYGAVQFDSTYNYAKNQSNIDISESEIKGNKDPYNTYTNKGLPPGPIGNPGDVAMKAALNPTHDGWYYFVATDGVSKTEFAKTHDAFLKLKDKFDARTGR